MNALPYAAITIYIVENGLVIKNSSPESLIGKHWVARTKEELIKVVSEIAEDKLKKIGEK